MMCCAASLGGKEKEHDKRQYILLEEAYHTKLAKASPHGDNRFVIPDSSQSTVHCERSYLLVDSTQRKI